MATHLKVIQDEKAKGNLTTKVQEAADELAYLMTFKHSITQAMARTICRNCQTMYSLIWPISLCSDMIGKWTQQPLLWWLL